MPRGEIQWEDLPASIRHRIQDARHAERRKAPKIPGTKRWQCCACGDIFYSWASAERHAIEQGHRRIELLLDVDADDERGSLDP